jgi:hypothetical protein
LEASIKTLSRLGFTVHFPRHSTEPEPFVHALWRFDNPVVVIPSKAIQSSFWHDLAVAIDHSPACFIIELMQGMPRRTRAKACRWKISKQWIVVQAWRPEGHGRGDCKWIAVLAKLRANPRLATAK